MRHSRCLTPAELTAFNLGELPETVLEEVAEHMEHCPHCEGAARSLDGVSDAVIDGIRDSAGGDTVVVPRSPVRIGDYEILGELGRGGMGVVYRARHLRLGRVAALKMLLGGEFSDPQERARFQTEAEAVARLQHPNIVQVYEAGQHEGGDGAARPYFTLEYVEGGSLAQRLCGRPQPPSQAAAWLEPLARALHYAHTQGVVHRDLKPSNVLLTSDNQPKLCDFGVAKILTGSDLKTRSGMLIGTAEYMAPEQATGRTDVGPAADVYALGALLYTLLTGRPPFQAASPLDTLAHVAYQEPVPPRRLQPAVPRDLETICLKCLQKEPHRRYGSAAALADDLRRFQSGQPIQARPVGLLERLGKWARRQPAVAASLAAVVLLTALAFALIVRQVGEANDRARRDREGFLEAKKNAQRVAFEAQLARQAQAMDLLARAATLCERGEVPLGMLTYARGLEVAADANAPELTRVARCNLALWQYQLIRQRGAFHHDNSVTAVALSPDGRTAATASNDSTGRLWDVATGKPIGEPLAHRGPVLTVAFSPDGRTVATGSSDGTARLWNATTGKAIGKSLAHRGPVLAVAFSPDSKTLLTGAGVEKGAGEVRLWHIAGGKPLTDPLDHATKVTGVAFSADGKQFLTVSPREARLWDTATRQRAPWSCCHATRDPAGKIALWSVIAGALSRDGKYVLTGGGDGTARLWDAATGKPVGPAMRHRGPVQAVAFRPDGRQIATGSAVGERDEVSGKTRPFGGEARVWDAQGKPLTVPLSHPEVVRKVALNGDGLLLTGAQDRCARVFDVASGQLLGQPLLHEGTVLALALSADGQLLLTGPAVGEGRQAARLWSLPRSLRAGALPPPPTGEVWSIRFKQDGKTLVTGGTDGVVRLWDRAKEKCLGEPLAHPPKWVVALALSNDNRKVVASWADERGHKTSLWDEAAGKVVHTWYDDREVRATAISPDGRTVLTGTLGGTVRFRDANGGKAVGQPLAHPCPLLAAAFDPNGETVVTAADDGLVRRWEWKTGKLVGAVKASTRPTLAAVAPNGGVVLTAPHGPRAQLWGVADGKPHGPPLSHRVLPLIRMSFSADSGTVLTGGHDGTARLWDVATGQPLGPPLPHASAVVGLAFAPDGRVVATAEKDGPVRFWNIPQRVGGDAERVRLWVELLTAMGYDNHGAARDLDQPALDQRRQRLNELGGLPERE